MAIKELKEEDLEPAIMLMGVFLVNVMNIFFGF